MIESFYDIKPLSEWLRKDSGLIYQNDDAFVSLNMMPASFGHSLVIPKAFVRKATELSPVQLWNLQMAKEEGVKRLDYIINSSGERGYILELYQRWECDNNINAQMPSSERIKAVRTDLDHIPSRGAVNVFENTGEDAGQVVEHYHMHIIPRLESGLKGGGEAFFQYLHGKR